MVQELWPGPGLLMELSQGQIIQKPNKQELSFLFKTYRLNVMHASVKFHKYIPYGLGVMTRTRIGTDGGTGVTLNPLSFILRIGGGINIRRKTSFEGE